MLIIVFYYSLLHTDYPYNLNVLLQLSFVILQILGALLADIFQSTNDMRDLPYIFKAWMQYCLKRKYCKVQLYLALLTYTQAFSNYQFTVRAAPAQIFVGCILTKAQRLRKPMCVLHYLKCLQLQLDLLADRSKF